MPVPETTGGLKLKLSDMNIGDYIYMGYDNATSNYVIGGDLSSGTELPLEGVAKVMPTNNPFWYGVKVAKGIILSDRVVLHTISWLTLNTHKLIEGKKLGDGFIRSISGGICYADKDGKPSASDLGYGGFPTINEWDELLEGFPDKLITPGKTLDDVFHHSRPNYSYTWCQEVPRIGTHKYGGIAGVSTNSSRIYRTRIGNATSLDFSPVGNTESIIGFRPLFEYKEV